MMIVYPFFQSIKAVRARRGVWPSQVGAMLAALLFWALPWSIASALGSAAATVTMTSSANPTPAGLAAILTARVVGSSSVFAPSPTGTVKFTDSTGFVLCTSGVFAGSGSNTVNATCSFPATRPVGNHTIFVAYSGDLFYNAAGAPGFVQSVAPSYTVTANAGTGGTVSPGRYTFVARGDSVFFDFTANTGFHLASVVASPAGCGGALSGNPGLTGTTRYSTDGMQFNCNFAATFSNTYTLSFTAGPGGSISPSGTRQTIPGSSTTVTVTPDAGFRLTNVTGCGVVFNGGPAITAPTLWATASVVADCTVSAFFTALPTFTVTAAAGAGGSISPTSVAVPQGLTTTFNVSPASGFQIATVSGCGGTRSGSMFTTGPITAACAVMATFSVAALPTFTVSALAGTGGSISPPSSTVVQGSTASFSVTANSGFNIGSVTGCNGSLAGSTYTTGAITAACTVSASFTATTVTPPATTTRMIEFIFPALDYYFLTSRTNEIALLDSLPAFARTGQSFNVYVNRVVGTQPITRFYFNKVALNGARDGHFYTLVDAEISVLLGLNPTNVIAPKLPVSEGVDSFAFPPAVEGVGGTCPSGLTPVFRVFRGNVRFPDDPNHRFTTSTAIYNEFVAKGWSGEGVKLCVPMS